MILRILNLKLNKYKINILFFIKHIFEYKHAHKDKCSGANIKKCPVCSTPWPVLNKTPIQKYLESINYYKEYQDIFDPESQRLLSLPKGMKGEEILSIAKSLNLKYTLNKNE
jgi:hypothetical protein